MDGVFHILPSYDIDGDLYGALGHGAPRQNLHNEKSRFLFVYV